MENEYQPGNKVQFKKQHPCGGNIWEIIRIGADFKARCTTCGRMIMLSRRKFEKAVKKKLDNDGGGKGCR